MSVCACYSTVFRAAAPSVAVLEKRLGALLTTGPGARRPSLEPRLRAGLRSRAAPRRLAVACSVYCSRPVTVYCTPYTPGNYIGLFICLENARLRYRPQNRFCEERHNWPISFRRNKIIRGCFSSTSVKG